MLLSEIARKQYVNPVVSIELGDRDDPKLNTVAELILKISVEAGESEAGRVRVGGSIDEVEEDEIFQTFTFDGKTYKKGGYFPMELVDNIMFPENYKDDRVVNGMSSDHLSSSELEKLLNDFITFLGHNADVDMPVNNVGYTY